VYSDGAVEIDPGLERPGETRIDCLPRNPHKKGSLGRRMRRLEIAPEGRRARTGAGVQGRPPGRGSRGEGLQCPPLPVHIRQSGPDLGTYKTVMTRTGLIEDSQDQISAHIRQSGPEFCSYKTVRTVRQVGVPEEKVGRVHPCQREILSPFDDKYPQNGSKNEVTALRKRSGFQREGRPCPPSPARDRHL